MRGRRDGGQGPWHWTHVSACNVCIPKWSQSQSTSESPRHRRSEVWGKDENRDMVNANMNMDSRKLAVWWYICH